MTTRPLPELDLAIFAPLPTEQKRRALEGFRLGIPPYSYNPVRASLSDILNLDAGMFGAIGRAPFARIVEQIEQASSKGREGETEANLRVAAGLYDYASAHGLRGRKEDEFRPMLTRVGEKLVYWTSAVLMVNGRPLVPFFNPRRRPLTSDGCRFALSMMHEQIRGGAGDYKDVDLGIFHFARTDKGPRAPRLTVDQGIELFSVDQLQEMVTETYDIWREISEGRVEEARRRTGSEGPLL